MTELGDLGELIGDAARAAEDAVKVGADIGEITEHLRETVGESQVPIPETSIEVNDGGNVTIDGENMNLDPESTAKFTEELFGKGDTEAALEVVGVPDEVIKSEAMQTYINTSDAAIKDSAQFRDAHAASEAAERGTELGKDSPQNPTSEDYDKADKTDKNVKKANEEISKKSKLGKAARVVGTFIKATLPFGIAAGASALIYELIEKHQHAMNGCWLVNNSSGSKSKVPMLTCNTANLKDTSNFSLSEYGCTDCVPYNCGDTSKGGGCSNTCGGTNGTKGKYTDCCDYFNVQGEEGVIICQKYVTDKSGKVLYDTTQNPKVPLCAKCLPQSKGGNCSQYCNSAQLANVPKGFHLTCKSADFWEAAGDFLGDALKGILSGLGLGGIWNILKWIVLAVGVIILAVIVWQVIRFILSFKRKRSGFGHRKYSRLKG